MSKIRFSLNVFDVGVVFFGLVTLIVLNLEILVVGTDPVAEEHDPTANMPTEMEVAYTRWLRDANSVSVFVRGKTAFGWVNGYLDRDAAERDAMVWCRREGPDCAEMEMRVKLNTVAGSDHALTDAMAVGFERFAKTPGPVSFAVADTGAFSAGRGRTLNGSDANALAKCVQMSVQDRPRHLPRYPCRVIARH